MNCVAGCICNCGQGGCGCHEGQRPTLPPLPQRKPKAKT
jgi:hypothetical protein